MRAGDSLEERAARFRKECRHAEIPTTVVAIEGKDVRYRRTTWAGGSSLKSSRQGKEADKTFTFLTESASAVGGYDTLRILSTG